MKLVSLIFSFLLMLASSANSAQAMQPRQPRGPGDFGTESTLKQADDKNWGLHGLHCGYYALWNAVCSVRPNLQPLRLNHDAFREVLTLWENFIGTRRGPGACVNDLEPNELDALVEQLGIDDDNITVIPSRNNIQGYVQGHGLTYELLGRIRRFRENNQTQAIIINTELDVAARQRGTGHFITIILSADANKVHVYAYNSSLIHFSPVPKENVSAYINNFFQPLYNLFEVENFEVLKVRKALCLVVEAVRKYCKAAEQNPFSWAYISMLEEYLQALKDTLTQMGKNIECSSRAEFREMFGMQLSGYDGPISDGYAELLKLTISSLMENLAPDQQQAATLNLSQNNYAIEPHELYNIAGFQVSNAYRQAQVTEAVFRDVALKMGIDQQILDIGIALAQSYQF